MSEPNILSSFLPEYFCVLVPIRSRPGQLVSSDSFRSPQWSLSEDSSVLGSRSRGRVLCYSRNESRMSHNPCAYTIELRGMVTVWSRLSTWTSRGKMSSLLSTNLSNARIGFRYTDKGLGGVGEMLVHRGRSAT